MSELRIMPIMDNRTCSVCARHQEAIPSGLDAVPIAECESEEGCRCVIEVRIPIRMQELEVAPGTIELLRLAGLITDEEQRRARRKMVREALDRMAKKLDRMFLERSDV